MRLSRYFLPILRETPKEAEIVSHRRGGLIPGDRSFARFRPRSQNMKRAAQARALGPFHVLRTGPEACKRAVPGDQPAPAAPLRPREATACHAKVNARRKPGPLVRSRLSPHRTRGRGEKCGCHAKKRIRGSTRPGGAVAPPRSHCLPRQGPPCVSAATSCPCISRCETISASLGVSRRMGRK
jgi:hypothetical protein